MLQPSKVSDLLGFGTFAVLVPRFLYLIAVPVSRPPSLGSISVEARATAICLAEVLEDAETRHHDVRSSHHCSWVHLLPHLSAASQCRILRAKLKAFLWVTERCRKAIVAMSTMILL